MDFRFIRGRSVAGSPAGIGKASRNLGLGVVICAVLGTSAFAQATLDFLDPLDTERVRIEERGDAPATRDAPPPRLGTMPAAERDDESVLIRARDGAASGAETVRDGASGFWGTLHAALSSIATTLGLPVLGLVALLFVLVAGLAALVGWTLFRGRRSYRAERSVDDVYARSSRDAAKRRAMGSGIKPAVTVEEPDFEETMPEDFDSIFADENDLPATRPAPDARKTATDGWRKPNLDRLRDSIKADWKADKAEKAEKDDVRPRSRLAADDVAVSAASTARSFADPRATASEDPASRKLDDLSDGWEEWDAQDKPEDDLWGETLPTTTKAEHDDGETATSRIRALRESLRAS